MESPQALEIFWQMMFGKEYSPPVDPNRPENALYIKHKKEQGVRAIKAWLSSGGEQLMQGMMKRVRHRMFEFAYVPLDTEEDRQKVFGKLKEYQMEIEFLGILLNAIKETEK